MNRWIGFHILLFVLLMIDLMVSRKQEMRQKKAFFWSLGWISLALLFNGYIFATDGCEKGMEFLTAYIVEKSLSIDNLFVFLLIFLYFQVPKDLQHRVLYIGVIGAVLMRLGLILGGVSLINLFDWLIYVLGIIVGFTGVRLILQKKEAVSIENSRLIGFFRRHFNISSNYVGNKTWFRKGGVLFLTPLFLVQLAIECSDLIFALDSIPAVIAVTRDSFIAYTSNVFAVLGLRSLYFLIAPWFDRLSYLKIGLGAILIFVGLKMVVSPWIAISLAVSLSVISTILVISALYSVSKK